jgi:glycosyltransferase involved in cell wall biosynthesis
MRILELICSSATGGAENHTRLISKALAKRGCEVYLVCPPGDYVDKYVMLKEFGVNVIVQKMSNIPFTVIPVIRKIIKEKKIEILHTHMHKADFIGALTHAKLDNTVLVSTIHSLVALDLKGSMKKYLYHLPIKYALNKMDKIFTVSENVKQFAIKYFNLPEGKIITILNSVDLEELNPDNNTIHSIKERLGITANHKVILCIGRLEQAKGQHILIKAINMLKKDYKNIKLLLIGKGPDGLKLKKMVKNLGLDGQVIFLGYQDNIADFLDVADIVVLPSFREALARTILEAMALEVPVIATDVGGNSEVVKNGWTGMLVKPGDEIGLTRCIAEMLNNKKKCLAIGKNAVEFIKNNSTMEIMADKTLCEFKKLLIQR